MRVLTFIVTVAAVLVAASSAAAAPPVKRSVWVKAAAAWKAQAVAHGATANCTAYDPSGARGMSCTFGDKGRVGLSYSTTPCEYGLLVGIPRGGGLPASFMRSETLTLNYCQPRWWLTLPAPWTPGL